MNPPDENIDELPSYSNLQAEAEAEGGATAARWNRWRGWIEKRAAERYTENPEQRKKPTGWGPSTDIGSTSDPSLPTGSSAPSAPKRQDTRLSIPPPEYLLPEPCGSQGQVVDPSRLALHNFGSRFLPHSTDKILCLLPILLGKFLLIGTTRGLSVIDVHPSLHPRKGEQALALNPTLTSAQPLADAVSIPIWIDLAVYQLDILEHTNIEESMDNPQGVILALVGTPDEDSGRSIRMYNLASIASLVRWFVTQQDHPPLDMHNSSAVQDTLSISTRNKLKRSRHHSSELARGLKSLVVDELRVSSPAASPLVGRSSERSRSPLPPSTTPPPPLPARPNGRPSVSMSPSSVKSTSVKMGSPPLPPIPRSPSTTSVASSSWDIVDDLPLRWASDYVPFAGPSSRLANTPVCFYQLSLARDSRTTTKLAVASKTNILLYETEDRAFKFAKEFYTPLPAKSISFIFQTDSAQNSHRGSRASSDEHHVRELRRQNSSGPSPSLRRRNVDYGTQLCLFVAFEKKAGLIRVGDAAVMEVESFPDIGATISTPAARPRGSLSFEAMSPTSGSIRRHLVNSLDGNNFWRTHTPWLALTELPLPPLSPTFPTSASGNVLIPDSICFITRGRTTQIYPCPLPMSFGNPSATSAPLKTLTWHAQHSQLQARISFQEDTKTEGSDERVLGPAPPFLQVIGFGDDGVEVQEISLEFLLRPSDSKPKGKAKASPLDTEPITRAFGDVGGAARFLCSGGQWNKPLSRISPIDAQRGALNSPIVRHDTWGSVDSTYSPVSTIGRGPGSAMSHVTVTGRATYEGVGVYGWAARGIEDYRVFWLGDGAELT